MKEINMKEVNTKDGSIQEEKIIERKEIVAKKRSYKKFFVPTIFLIAILGVYGSFHYYKKYQALKIDPSIEVQKKTATLVGTLGKLMELPKDEVPTVATISDKEKLKGQDFFTLAENGDVLFAYTTAMKAILYRPSTNKIINVAPISINPSQGVTQAVKKEAPVETPKKQP